MSEDDDDSSEDDDADSDDEELQAQFEKSMEENDRYEREQWNILT